jgi:pimeloyl-ACP methyl ester carboxylesterase
MITTTATTYHTTPIDGLDIFHRQAGDPDNPAIVLLHGFPSSSHQYRNLISLLAERHFVIAPDYPGFGHSEMPLRTDFDYRFDHFASLIEQLLHQLGVRRFALYLFDYGAPVGLRLYQHDPTRVTALITQNGNAYEEGIADFWDPIKAYWETGAETEREAIRWLTTEPATRWQYENGTPAARLPQLSPDGRAHDQAGMDRPGNADIQLDLFFDYRTNLPLYAAWQQTFREQQTPALVVWGRNDEIFVAPGARAYARDLPNAEIHLLDAGHFLLETHLHEVHALIDDFLERVLD